MTTIRYRRPSCKQSRVNNRPSSIKHQSKYTINFQLGTCAVKRRGYLTLSRSLSRSLSRARVRSLSHALSFLSLFLSLSLSLSLPLAHTHTVRAKCQRCVAQGDTDSGSWFIFWPGTPHPFVCVSVFRNRIAAPPEKVMCESEKRLSISIYMGHFRECYCGAAVAMPCRGLRRRCSTRRVALVEATCG